jgi:hypothetical protein
MFLRDLFLFSRGHRLTRIAKIADVYGRTSDSAEEHDAYYLAAACMLPEAMLRLAVRGGQSADEIGTAYPSLEGFAHCLGRPILSATRSEWRITDAECRPIWCVTLVRLHPRSRASSTGGAKMLCSMPTIGFRHTTATNRT